MPLPTINKTAEIADAVAQSLMVYFGGAYCARVYSPTVDLKSLQTFAILVMAKGHSIKVIDRATNVETHQVDVGLLRKVDPSDPADVDAMMLELEKLKLLFAIRDDDDLNLWEHQGALRDEEMAGAEWTALANDLLYDQSSLTDGQFFSVVTLDYELTR